MFCFVGPCFSGGCCSRLKKTTGPHNLVLCAYIGSMPSANFLKLLLRGLGMLVCSFSLQWLHPHKHIHQARTESMLLALVLCTQLLWPTASCLASPVLLPRCVGYKLCWLGALRSKPLLYSCCGLMPRVLLLQFCFPGVLATSCVG